MMILCTCIYDNVSNGSCDTVEYIERQSAQREASHDLRETSHDQPQKQTKEHNQTGELFTQC